jgi:hypothetical protein
MVNLRGKTYLKGGPKKHQNGFALVIVGMFSGIDKVKWL